MPESKTCSTCQKPMISDGPTCGACLPSAEAVRQLDKAVAAPKGRYRCESQAGDMSGFDDPAPREKQVMLSAFTSGWAAGLMMAQMEYCDRMVYRKSGVKILDASNGRTKRHCHCGKCSNGQCGLCERKHA